MKYTVHMTSTLSTEVEIEAEDYDDAIDKAYDSEGMPPDICAYCSGWGQSWNMDTSGEWEPQEVTNADDKVVWPKK